MSNLLSLGIIGAIAFFVWSKWDDIQGMFTGTGQAVQQVNPFVQIPAFFQAQQDLAVAQAKLETKYMSIEKDIHARKQEIEAIDTAGTEYAKLEAYKKSYELEKAHREHEGFTPYSIIYEGQKVSFNTPAEFLEWTLINKGVSRAERDYIVGQTDVSPSLPPKRTPAEAMGFIQKQFMLTKQVMDVVQGTPSPSPTTPSPSPITTNQQFYEEQLQSGAFTQQQYEHNMRYFA